MLDPGKVPKRSAANAHAYMLGEGSLLGHIRHKRIVNFYGTYLHTPNLESSPWECLVTEYCPYSLDTVLAKLSNKYKENPAAAAEDEAFSDHSYNILQYARDIAEGLAYLHHECQPPVVHRDIKSGNMLVSRDNHIKICDFGSAALHREGDMITQAGTPQFSAPELILPANRHKINQKCDIWSFACVLWHMITLASPHEEAPHQFTALMWVGWGQCEITAAQRSTMNLLENTGWGAP